MSTSERSLPKYSVLMSVYEKDNPVWFEEAVESMAQQSLTPDEIVIVEDGPIPDALHAVARKCSERHPGLIRCIPLQERGGLGIAMQKGVLECRNNWIARMDADDVSEPNRCEDELVFAQKNGADIVGCDCEEFVDSIQNAQTRRVFPEKHEDIVAFSRRRTPFCHPAVMMKKDAVLKAGNYQDVYLLEDYDLFVRMLATGAIGCTLKKCLYHVRTSRDFYNRRSGLQYTRTLLSFNLHLLKTGWMRFPDFCVRSCGNVFVGLAPASVRQFVYKRLLRK